MPTATGARPASRIQLLTPLRHRDFRLLWTGMSISLLGDGILLVALAWQTYSLSNTPAAMSAVGIALSAPQITLLLLGGVVSDRFDRRRIMLLSDLIRGGCLAALALLAFSGTLALWHLFALAAVYGGASGFFGPAFDAVVPELVPADDLVHANALDQFIRPSAMHILGPALGGGLIAVAGAGWGFVLDALTFLISSACLVRMRPPSPTPAAGAATVWRELRDGLGYVRRNVWLWGTFAAATITYLLFLGPTEVLLPYVVKNALHGTPASLGLILASGGLGAVLAALVVGQAGVPKSFVTFMYLTWTLATLAVAGYGLAQRSWQLAFVCAVVNGLEAAGTIAWVSAKQRLVPNHMLGRVSSIDWFISIALLPLSYAIAAPVAHAFGAQNTLVIAGVLGALVTLTFLHLPGLRAVQWAAQPKPATVGR